MAKVIEVINLSKKFDIFSINKNVTFRDKIINKLRIVGQNKKDVKADDSFWALKNINLSIDEGEIIGIIGENGAGKSTLLKIFSKITPPTDGLAKIKGRVSSLLEVGVGFHPELTGRENVFLSGSILGMSKSDITKKLSEIINFSGINKFIDVPVKKYSSGMYVRLAFSVAVFLDFDILFIDEILSVGDVDFQKKSHNKLRDIINEKEKTVLFVSHNLESIKQICSKCILMEEGRIKMIDESRIVIDEYLKKFNSIHEKKQKKFSSIDNLVKEFKVVNEKNELKIKSFDSIRFILVLGDFFKFEKIKINIGIYNSKREILFKIHTKQIKKEKIKNNRMEIITSEINLSPQVCYVDLSIFLDGVKKFHSFNVSKIKIEKNNMIEFSDIDLGSVDLLLKYKLSL